MDSDPKSLIIQQQKEHKEAQNAKEEQQQEEAMEDGEQNLNDSIKTDDSTQNNSFIDNPYLAATKMPAKDHIDVC